MSVKTFCKKTTLSVNNDEAFAWHERPGAFERLLPPWESVSVLDRGNGIGDGSRVELVNRLGPFRLKWLVEHKDYQRGRLFRDRQIKGPFRSWEHSHCFHPESECSSVLEDRIQYEVPCGTIGQLFGGHLVSSKLDKMFEFRHRMTAHDLAAHSRFAAQGSKRIVVTGSTGLIGSALVPMLTTGGHQVTRLKRARNDSQPEDLLWDPTEDRFNGSRIDGVEAVVHLAGKNLTAKRWNDSFKARVRDSRVHGTRTLCEGLARMSNPPRTLVCASAIGYYGDRGDDPVDEQSDRGEGFLAEIADQWERATEPAKEAGIRVVHLRIGMVLSPRGGALAAMLPLFRYCVGGRLGSGHQYWSWISIDDVVGAVHHALLNESISGPLNAVAPFPVTNAEFTKTMNTILRRPNPLRVPKWILRTVMGEMADDLLLTSTRVVPKRLLETDYSYREPTLESALKHLLGR